MASSSSPISSSSAEVDHRGAVVVVVLAPFRLRPAEPRWPSHRNGQNTIGILEALRLVDGDDLHQVAVGLEAQLRASSLRSSRRCVASQRSSASGDSVRLGRLVQAARPGAAGWSGAARRRGARAAAR